MTKEYQPIMLNMETGSRLIKTPEEARKVIASTATSWCLTEKEARHAIPLFKEIASAMGLNLNHLVSYRSKDPNDYANHFRWEVTKKFIKKPLEVVAWQFNPQEPHPNWVDMAIEMGLISRVLEPLCEEEYIIIHKKEGTLIVREQDFLIDGGNQDFYPCEESIFYKTYEEVK